MDRRTFPRAAPVLGFTGAAVGVQQASGADQSPQEAWAVIMASLRREVGADCRVQIMGGDGPLFAVIWRTVMEQVSPHQTIPVDRIVASYSLKDEGWVQRSAY